MSDEEPNAKATAFIGVHGVTPRPKRPGVSSLTGPISKVSPSEPPYPGKPY